MRLMASDPARREADSKLSELIVQSSAVAREAKN